MICIYVYYIESGLFRHEDFGLAKYVMKDMPDGCDFTLTRPPDYDHVWRWIDDKWIADQPS